MLTLYNWTGGPTVQTPAVSTHSVPEPTSRRGCQQIHASEACCESGAHQNPTRNRPAVERGRGRSRRRHHGLLLHLRNAGAQRRNFHQMENHGRDQSHASADGLQSGGRTIRRQDAVFHHHREGRVRPLRTLQRCPHRLARRNVNFTCF